MDTAAVLVVAASIFLWALVSARGRGGRRGESGLRFLEQTSGLVSLLVWVAFGALALPLEHVSPLTVLYAALYAVLSLTLVRMVPVALALLGAGLDRRTVVFVGWFGPRGLASLVFALLALEELGEDAEQVVALIGLTVLLSMVAHGISAHPLAARHGRSAAARTRAADGPPGPPPPRRAMPRPLGDGPVARPPREDVIRPGAGRRTPSAGEAAPGRWAEATLASREGGLSPARSSVGLTGFEPATP